MAGQIRFPSTAYMTETGKSLSIAWMCLFASFIVSTAAPSTEAISAGLVHREFMVDGLRREALLYVPSTAASNVTPLVFVFHGHGGSSTNTARSFAIHRHWPEAVSVYMQGLKTPGRLTDPEGRRTGWQKWQGDQKDRDLKLFDAVVKQLSNEYRIHPKRIYSTGHSNGGAFTYLLWQTRGDILAAVAPSAAAGPFLDRMNLRPKPVLHLAGEKDALVKYEWQQKTMEAIRRINGCDSRGKPWEGKLSAPGVCTIYPSQSGAPVWTFIHPGAHGFPAAGPALIAGFFKEN